MKKTITGSIFSANQSISWKSKINTLVNAGDYDSAIAKINEQFQETEKNSSAWYLLADIHNKQMDFPSALVAINKSLKSGTNDKKLKLKAIILSNLKYYDQSLSLAHEIYPQNSNDITLVNVLKVGYFNTGNNDKAITYGRRSLDLWDKIAGNKQQVLQATHAVHKKTGKKKIVSFSLYGKEAAYNIGAMVNARLVQCLLPGWVSRFYIGKDVPKNTITDLKRIGAEIVYADETFPEIPKLSWRFLIVDDPTSDYFLCRDCDSRISPKEVAAVQEWLNSEKLFHIMRDHILHTDLILGGMWGGRGGTNINIRKKIEDPRKNHKNFSYNADQVFLALEIWPLIRNHSFIHDSYYNLHSSKPFPLYGKGSKSFHVGGGVKAPQILQKECKIFGITYSI